MKQEHMYEEVKKSWNPFVGCEHGCVYCDPSFKRQAKRQLQRCKECHGFTPHLHPERLEHNSFPHTGLVFVCSMSDIAFATYSDRMAILDVIRDHPKSTFLLQSKNPMCFYGLSIPENVIVGTTLESSRWYPDVSSAPSPENRATWMRRVKHKRKAVTVEPIMEFYHREFVDMIRGIHPEIVWVGYNNYPKSVQLNEPPLEKTMKLVEALKKFTDVRLKTIREKYPLEKTE